MKTRIYFLDNLRTFLIFLVIVLHAGMTYESGFDAFWIVSDPAKYDPLAWVRTYLDLFVMFAMFFISGYFTPASLRKKTTTEFVKSKVKRILVPWAIAVFTLIPAYKAIFLYSRRLPQEEWFSYFHLFQRTGTDLTNFANNPSQNWLWFLPVLFLFQMIYLGLSNIYVLSIKISLKKAVTLTFIVGLIYSMVISLLNLRGWAHSPLFDFQRERILIYFMMFLLGSLCYKLNAFEQLKRNTRLLVPSVITLIGSLVVFKTIALNLFYNLLDPTRNYFLISEQADRLVYYFSSLLAMLSLLYLLIYVFKFFFNRSNNLVDQLSKSSYTVYIIHMIVLGVAAVLLMNIQLSAIIKYALLIISTFVISNAIAIGYSKFFQNRIYLRTSAFVILTGSLFAFILSGNPAQANQKENQIQVTRNSVSAPAMGIHEAALVGDMEVIRQHIEAGTDLNEKDPSGGGSPLHTAITFGKTEVALALIEAGAKVNYLNNEGSTPLHTAAFFGQTEIVEALLANGADKNIRNNAGSTALESVIVPFEAVQGIYDYFQQAYAPLGLSLDIDLIKTNRPIIAAMLQ